MADNTVINLGSGGDTIASDDVAGVKHQRVKVTLGRDGVTNGDVSEANPMPVHVQASGVDTFGRIFTAHQNNTVDVNFSLNAPTTYCTVTTASAGAAATATGAMAMTTTTTTGSTVSVVTNSKINYLAGGEIFALFTTAFTTGVASTLQRIGAFDANNGVFIQYNGTAFQFTVRQNAVDTSTAIASWSVDALTGAAGSLFTRNGTPEAINLTLLNVWRIRFGWLGAAPIKLEVLSPDGEWVLCHVVKYPNTSANPSIYATDLPMAATVTNSASTALTFRTACWGAGSTSDAQTSSHQDVRYYATAAASGATTVETAITLTRSFGATPTTTGTSFAVTRGKRFRITAITVATRGHATATIQATTFNLRYNAAGAVTTASTPVLLAVRSATPATSSAWDRFIVPLPDDGIEIAGDGTATFGITAAATYTTNAPTWDVTIFGYEY